MTETALDRPRLTRVDPPGPARSAVLLLHGGAQRSHQPVDAFSASWQLMRWFQRDLARAVSRGGSATSVWLLAYRVRGWNGGSPVDDARWALDTVAADLGDIPVALVGHSMGGRTALHVADHPAVAGVVALAPWIQSDTPVRTLSGRRLVAAHGRADKITSYAATRAYVERARSVAAEARFVDMGPLGHYLVRRHGSWRDLTRGAALGMLPA